ncbi:MAG: hypothetical protein AAF513_07155 [Pseudomonadota bacterium]
MEPLLVETRLLAPVFDRFEAQQSISVLDLGPGQGRTVAFLQQFHVKLYCADLASAARLVDANAFADYEPEEQLAILRTTLTKQLGLPDGSRLDACLFWDYLHLLSPTALIALNDVLTPHLTRHTQGYGFGALYNNATVEQDLFAIEDSETLAIFPEDNKPMPFTHSQQRLNESLNSFKVSRGTLLHQGRLELLFERNA